MFYKDVPGILDPGSRGLWRSAQRFGLVTQTNYFVYNNFEFEKENLLTLMGKYATLQLIFSGIAIKQNIKFIRVYSF
jgi:hypothetical protein